MASRRKVRATPTTRTTRKTRPRSRNAHEAAGGEGEVYRQTLERAKRASPAQLLFRASRLLNERGLARIRERGRKGVRTSHTALLPYIDLDGTRITQIARRMGVTKQAVNQAVGEIEAMGLVRRSPDPSDGRAKLVHFTARGRRELLLGLGVLGELEEELSKEIGKARVARLRDDLAALVDYLEGGLGDQD
jgi:DNA-binding MarR family transcriptional regulator